MKKIISLALCLILGGFVLTGCSNSSEPFAEKSHTPDTQVDEINLDVADREIEVTLSARSILTIRKTARSITRSPFQTAC